MKATLIALLLSLVAANASAESEPTTEPGTSAEMVNAPPQAAEPEQSPKTTSRTGRVLTETGLSLAITGALAVGPGFLAAYESESYRVITLVATIPSMIINPLAIWAVGKANDGDGLLIWSDPLSRHMTSVISAVVFPLMRPRKQATKALSTTSHSDIRGLRSRDYAERT